MVVNVVSMSREMKDELCHYFDSLVLESEIYKQRSREAAINFALEKRVPDKDEYSKLMKNILDDVLENDETINQKMEEKMISMSVGNDSEITAAILKLMKLLGKDIKITDEESQLH